jgi:hypothetical protein
MMKRGRLSNNTYYRLEKKKIEQSKVFANFEKEDYEWSDERGTKCLMTKWLIKKHFFKNTSPSRYEKFNWQLQRISLTLLRQIFMIL